MIPKARSLLLLALVGTAACGPPRRGPPVQPPLPVQDARIAEGERVFMRNCNGCHPGGAGGTGLAINDKPVPGFLIRFQVRHGLGPMPRFPDEILSDRELGSLVRYLKALRRHDVGLD